MLKVSRFVFNMFGVNTYVVWDDEALQAVVVDPGMIDSEEREALDGFITRNKLAVTGIVNTHLHLDHCFGVDHVKTAYSADVMAGSADAPLGASVPEQSRRFGIPNLAGPVAIDRTISHGDRIAVGGYELHVLAVPGHSPGSVALYSPDAKFVIVGDVLFERSIGRTDLPGGDFRTLIGSIHNQLLTLPDDVVVYSGHGNPTTIGQERMQNPYIQ